MRYIVSAAVFLVGCWAAWPLATGAIQGDSSGWAIGASLKEQLAAPLRVSWSNIPLARALKSLGMTQRLAIVLDRRIDPDQLIAIVLVDEPLRGALDKIARHVRAGYCQLGPIAYIGPPAMAQRLRTLAALRLEEIRPLPPAASRKFLLMRTSHWNDLAEPRRIIEELAQEAGVTIDGAEKIPHDLWPAADLPPLAWIDRLTLLAAQFELAFHVNKTGDRVGLVVAPEKVVLSRTYPAGRDAGAVARRWAKALPGAQITVEKNLLRLDGLLEDHEQVEQRLRGTPTSRPTVMAGKEVYQLSVENAALAQVVKQLAEQLNLRFEWDRAAIDAAGISVEQLVSVRVQNVSLDELMRAVLAGTGLAFRRDDRTVSIYPDMPSEARR